MFTGIVEELGHVVARNHNRFTFGAVKILEDLAPGGSVAVNGCCLTAVAVEPHHWMADVVDETLRRTTLRRLGPGDRVNLERPVRMTDRLGGHVVQGHVDGVGEVVGGPPALEVRVPSPLARYLAQKGSVAVDGCSLTVVDVLDDSFTVAVIPHTAEVTTLGRLRPGDLVNVEVDVLAKYVERLLAGHTSTAQVGLGFRRGQTTGFGAPGGQTSQEPGVGAPGGVPA